MAHGVNLLLRNDQNYSLPATYLSDPTNYFNVVTAQFPLHCSWGPSNPLDFGQNRLGLKCASVFGVVIGLFL